MLDAEGAPHIRIPLWSDPAIQQVNDEQAITAFISTGDPIGLEVPEHATIITIRALSAAEMGAAARAAGRRPQFGAVVAQRKAAFRATVGNITADPEAAAAFAEWLDALTDKEAAALDAWDAYESARFERIAVAGVVKVEHPGQTWEGAYDFLSRIPSPSLRDSLAHEFGFRVQGHSGLGIRPKGLCNSASGLAKPSEAAAAHTGDATDVMTSCDSGAATVAEPLTLASVAL